MIENKIQTEVKSRRGLHVILKTHFLMIRVYIQKLASDVLQQGKDRLALVNEKYWKTSW
jgi:thioredoxin-related protein